MQTLRRLMLHERQEYMDRVRATRPIAYWPLNDTGAVAKDWSGNGYNSTHTGTTPSQPGIGDGQTSQLYDGANDYTNIYSAGFAATFDATAGTVLLWARVAGAGVWSDGTSRRVVHVSVDDNNRFYMMKLGAPVNTLAVYYVAGGTYKGTSINTTETGWLCVALTWDKAGDAVRVFASGTQTGATQTGLGVWVGALANFRCCVGASTTVPQDVFSGTLAHVAVWDRALTPAQVAALSHV